MPWRVGADKNTTIKLSHDAKINGNSVSAGTYSFHAIVQDEEWTLILNSDHQAWGSYFYEPDKDVLRFKVKPDKAEFAEWLQFGFENLSNKSCTAYLHWGAVKVPFNIEFDHHKIVLEKYRQELTGLAGFNQAAWGTAARYCLQNQVNLNEAMTWIDKALSMNGGNTFDNKVVKAGLLTVMGKAADSDKIMQESMKDASEAELNRYGYQLMGQDKLDEAIKIFTLNVNRHPASWNTYDSLGEAYAKKGDKKGARMNYERAYEMAPGNQKSRLEGIIKGLK
jgi:tetratricopeptide (TPR) repeat protein